MNLSIKTGAPIIIVGAGGHGRVLLDLCRALDRTVTGFLDDRRTIGMLVDGVPILGPLASLLQHANGFANEFVVAIGILHGDQIAGNQLRRHIGDTAPRLSVLMHPSAIVSPRAEIGPGSVICAGSIVAAGVRIGRHCILNTGVIVDHDCILEDGVQLSPGVRLGGGVRLERDAFLGTGACLAPGIVVGTCARVGLGAGVLRDVPKGALAVGLPAVIVERRRTNL